MQYYPGTMARTADNVLITYLHPATRITLDYGSEISREHGVSWSHTGKASEAAGFEAFKPGECFPSVLAAKRAIIDEMDDASGRPRGSCVVIHAGERVTRKHDLNPRGLI